MLAETLDKFISDLKNQGFSRINIIGSVYFLVSFIHNSYLFLLVYLHRFSYCTAFSMGARVFLSWCEKSKFIQTWHVCAECSSNDCEDHGNSKTQVPFCYSIKTHIKTANNSYKNNCIYFGYHYFRPLYLEQ